MTLTFDTSVLINIERGDKETFRALRRLKEEFIGVPAIPYIVYVEMLYGVKKKNIKNQEKVLKLLNSFHLLLPSKEMAATFAELKFRYDSAGKRIPLMDLFIAAQVIAEGLVLVTSDKRFQEINELQCKII